MYTKSSICYRIIKELILREYVAANSVCHTNYMGNITANQCRRLNLKQIIKLNENEKQGAKRLESVSLKLLRANEPAKESILVQVM